MKIRRLLSAALLLFVASSAHAGGLSTYLVHKLLDHTLKTASFTPPATVYLGLSTTDPGAACTGYTETGYTSYARQAITFGAATSRSVTQSGTVTFPASTGGSSTVAYYVVADSATSNGGNILACGALSASKSIVSGNTPSVASGQVILSVSAGYVSNYLANKWLDFGLRNQAFTQPTHVYAAVTTSVVGDADTGSTIVEPSGNNYSRLIADSWSSASSRATHNTATMTLPTPSGSWGTITSSALLDAASTGNLLFYDNGTTDQLIGANDTVRWSTSAFTITVN